LRPNRGGVFDLGEHYPTPRRLDDVADVDLDGDLDLVGEGVSNLTIRLSDGNGGSQRRTS
jgi:hypothetical protein